jgi:hypothetical protein
MLDVEIGPETYVMEYLPSLRAVGNSRMRTATYGWEGVEHSFDDFESAREYRMSVLQNERNQCIHGESNHDNRTPLPNSDAQEQHPGLQVRP